MSCPHLKEVVMLFCDAYPVKKMLPLDRIATAHPCLGQEFGRCPLYCELMARLACGADLVASNETVADRKEAGHAARNRTDPRRADHAGPAHR